MLLGPSWLTHLIHCVMPILAVDASVRQDNNFTKSFNACTIDARYKPIRSMMDFIRRKNMNRLAIMGPSCEKWINEYSPS